MLQVAIPTLELWDETTNRFIYVEGRTLQLEHSLISISKWEAKWNKAFLSKKEKTREETLDYIRCMTLTKNVDDSTFTYIPDSVVKQINEYISAPMTATYIAEAKNGPASTEALTSELIYYWMISFNIPFECQKWHLNRLLMLIKVCNAKSQTPKKRNPKDIMRDYSAINAARRKKHNTRG